MKTVKIDSEIVIASDVAFSRSEISDTMYGEVTIYPQTRDKETFLNKGRINKNCKLHVFSNGVFYTFYRTQFNQMKEVINTWTDNVTQIDCEWRAENIHRKPKKRMMEEYSNL
jgi:hypothetical protein